MLIAISLIISTLTLLLTAAPFPGAVFLAPLLALLALHVSVTRKHWLVVLLCLINASMPWAAPQSLREYDLFYYLLIPTTALSLAGLIIQARRPRN